MTFYTVDVQKSFSVCKFHPKQKLKNIAKPGRMLDDNVIFYLFVFPNERYEIPLELSIPTCTECGSLYLVNEKLEHKILNSIDSQSIPSQKLLTLRWIDSSLQEMFKRPKMYGTKTALACQVISFLEFREMTLSKSKNARSREIQDAFDVFFKKYYPEAGNSVIPKNISIEELTSKLKQFVAVWVNT